MLFDSPAIARDFSRAATDYDKNAVLQHKVLERLFAFSQEYFLPRQLILDAGCGTGRLKDYLPDNCIIGVDIAAGMINAAMRRGERVLQADICNLPFAASSFDKIFCNLCLQWIDPPRIAFREFGRVLDSSGYIALSTLGPETLRELRQAFSLVDSAVHVSPFIPLEKLLTQVEEAGLQLVDRKEEIVREHYNHPREVLLRLKAIGASNKHVRRSRGLFPPNKMHALYDAYSTVSDEVTASWEIYYLLLEKGRK